VSRYDSGGRDLHADAEVAVEIGERDVVRGYGVALEIAYLGGGERGVSAVARNVFHRAVAFGPIQRTLPDPLVSSLRVNGDVRAEAEVDHDVAGRVEAVSRVLSAAGERLEPGDRIITGSVVQVRIAPGDEVVADIRTLGRVGVSLA
jgi:2-keto-4-pentenoate hydratase/2-oxohepta-3-ene-1,7-dioic acid hydratase in catechol pathway